MPELNRFVWDYAYTNVCSYKKLVKGIFFCINMFDTIQALYKLLPDFIHIFWITIGICFYIIHIAYHLYQNITQTNDFAHFTSISYNCNFVRMVFINAFNDSLYLFGLDIQTTSKELARKLSNLLGEPISDWFWK